MSEGADKDYADNTFNPQGPTSRNNNTFQPQLPGNNGLDSGNQQFNLAKNFVDYVGRSTSGLENQLEAAAPGFIEDIIDGLGLEGKPVLVLGLIALFFYALYKFA